MATLRKIMAAMMEGAPEPWVLRGSRMVGQGGLISLLTGMWESLVFWEQLYITIQCPRQWDN